jgi:hypothetical protein
VRVVADDCDRHDQHRQDHARRPAEPGRLCPQKTQEPAAAGRLGRRRYQRHVCLPMAA